MALILQDAKYSVAEISVLRAVSGRHILYVCDSLDLYRAVSCTESTEEIRNTFTKASLPSRVSEHLHI